ncbi:twin-arginine translocase TatA/TatE family subunit [Acidianus infernus]|uniref:Twin-arginine translocase TatA/TatE family subunit n=1 Tax=Acidianus infernus TaxID=12915 RepID=A0A6A9QIK7_ACIIN|nr:twin-arginine translocase TatA/TatE family subunit [Acidianus infernus]MUM64996.1 twin-arginine translocase TatA/TatE family subunit [Acidianus infernus]
MIGNPSDWVIIIIVALILFFGTSKIPELFRSMGRAIGEFKKGRLEAEMEMQQMQQPSNAAVTQQGDKVAELQKQIEELQKQLEQLKKQQEVQTQKQQ